MRVAYLDCFAGIAGDMMLGALIDAGVPSQVLVDAVAALGLGASLRIERVDRSGIACTKVHVFEGDHLAEALAEPEQQPAEQQPLKAATHTHQPKTQHLHKTGHPHSHDHEHTHAEDGPHTHSHDDHSHAHEDHSHTHEHAHAHGRSLTAIRTLIHHAALPDPVKKTAIRAFELLGHSEAKIHNVPLEEIHFHEVGAVDAIVDIVAASAGIHHLNVGAWYSSPINVGGGTVVCAHGTFPVPAPGHCRPAARAAHLFGTRAAGAGDADWGSAPSRHRPCLRPAARHACRADRLRCGHAQLQGFSQRLAPQRGRQQRYRALPRSPQRY